LNPGGPILSTNLPPLKADPLAAPKVEEATNIGMTQAITPYKRSARVWKRIFKHIVSLSLQETEVKPPSTSARFRSFSFEKGDLKKRVFKNVFVYT